MNRYSAKADLVISPTMVVILGTLASIARFVDIMMGFWTPEMDYGSPVEAQQKVNDSRA